LYAYTLRSGDMLNLRTTKHLPQALLVSSPSS